MLKYVIKIPVIIILNVIKIEIPIPINIELVHPGIEFCVNIFWKNTYPENKIKNKIKNNNKNVSFSSVSKIKLIPYIFPNIDDGWYLGSDYDTFYYLANNEISAAKIYYPNVTNNEIKRLLWQPLPEETSTNEEIMDDNLDEDIESCYRFFGPS